MKQIRIKICGLRSAGDLALAQALGVDYLGMIHYPGSPRHLELPAMIALAQTAGSTETGTGAVAVVADPSDAFVDALADSGAWCAIQYHGNETPERLRAIARLAPHIEIWKAVPVASAADVMAWRAYRDCAARIVFDARAPAGAAAPGGRGVSFDWTCLGAADLPDRWMLAGGLDPGNVREAVRASAAPAVDVSSGVEARAGVKDPDRMRAFVGALAGVRCGFG